MSEDETFETGFICGFVKATKLITPRTQDTEKVIQLKAKAAYANFVLELETN